MGKTFAKTTARSAVNNICLITTTAKKEKGVREAKKEQIILKTSPYGLLDPSTI